MDLIKFSDAVLYNLCEKTTEDFENDKTIKAKCIALGLEKYNVIYGAHKNKLIPASMFPYIRFDLARNVDTLTAVKAQTVRVYFEIGISLEREANSNTEITRALISFKRWMKANKILKLNGEIVTVGISGSWEIEFQYGINVSRETVNQRFATLQGGWAMLSDDDEVEVY